MNQVGSRIVCRVCGAQALVTSGGEGTVTCHGQPMEPAQKPGPQPAAPAPGERAED